jgi:phosphoribosylglycinamide formyltransferase-1
MKIVILGSGRGSNAEAIVRAQAAGQLGAGRVVQIFSDRPESGILALGEKFGVPARFLDPGQFKTKFDEAGESRYIEEILRLEPGLVVLAGFMRILKPRFIEAFAGKIINLHPSLLPSFPGLDSIGQAWRRGVKITGCTVHYVSAEVDGGPIIDQTAVRIETGDTLESLETKIHGAEHSLLPAVIARLAGPVT